MLKARADDMGIQIKLFPQKVTPLARSLACFDNKDDIADVTAIAEYLKVSPKAIATLKSFKPMRLEDYKSSRISKWEDRQELTDDVNAARNLGYQGDAVADWIQQNLGNIYNQLDPDLRDLLEMKLVYKGKPKEYISFSSSRLYTVVATLMRPDGSLRLRSDVQKLPYWKYAKEVYFAMTPYHMRGGVVASNVKHHWRRAASEFRKVSKKNPLLVSELAEFRQARSEFDKKLRRLWNTIRNLITNGCQIENIPRTSRVQASPSQANAPGQWTQLTCFAWPEAAEGAR
jgi:hypothetical protein